MPFDNEVNEPKLLKPVVVLAGNYTASAADDLLVIISQLKTTRIPILGEASTGVPPVNRFRFPLSGDGSARVCTKRDTYASGADFVGIGVKPDMAIQPTVPGIIRGQDVVLERAVALLTNQLPARPSISKK